MTTFHYSTSTNSASGTYTNWTFTTHHEPPPDDGMAGCFAVLGVPPGSPPDVVRKAYRAKLHDTHPDHGGSADAVRRVIDAYRKLSPNAA